MCLVTLLSKCSKRPSSGSSRMATSSTTCMFMYIFCFCTLQSVLIVTYFHAKNSCCYCIHGIQQIHGAVAMLIRLFIIMLSKASALKPPLKMSETIYQIAYINLLHYLEKPEELRSSEVVRERLLCNLNSVLSCLSITLQTKMLISLLVYRIDPLEMNKQQVHSMPRR